MIRYIFDPEVIHECAVKGIGRRKPEMFDVIAREIEKRYPGHVDHSQPWIYSIAGGAMIQMKLYFASLWEYVMIWGTPIGSEGHSGRHRVSFWDTVIDGETWYFAEGQFEKRIYRPGDRIFVGKGQACGMNFTDGVWAVEYARGPLLLSMPFGLADELFSALDLSTAVQTLSMYTSLIGRHWANKANRDYPLLVPFKKVSALFMNLIGPAVTRALTPPPPVEINPQKPAKTIPVARARRPQRAPTSLRKPARSAGTGGRPSRGPAAAPPAVPRARPRG
jgi:C-8 sterol isomerase